MKTTMEFERASIWEFQNMIRKLNRMTLANELAELSWPDEAHVLRKLEENGPFKFIMGLDKTHMRILWDYLMEED